ncbi:MAG: acyl-CoA dehydrogenase family protein [Actinomycetota bacterium]|nr:acyl-CoA dehydrogenase family protein [Actinomycetota bacterium]MEE3257073.1 acyl-CoA dehydrogenase family protein [Actinomycetota bacterium]
MTKDPVEHFFLSDESQLLVQPTLDALEAQAANADSTRTVASNVIESFRGSDVMRMAATTELGGVESSILAMGRELEAVAARCPSTAWCLWNHLAVFHLFVGTLGPEHQGFLQEVVQNGQWVSFPAGAGSGVHGRIEGDEAVLNGKATFGTGSRYADYCGVVFAVIGEDGEPLRPMDLRFSIVSTSVEGLKIDPTWDGSGLRASATDDLHYSEVRVPLDRCVQWYGANRAESLRTVPVINHRYREDWVGISDLWLGWMANGVVRRALQEVASSTRDRRVIMGGKMVEKPTAQVNIGRAAALLSSARAAIENACLELDQRVAAGIVPDEADYLRQMSVVSMSVEQLAEAMQLLERTQGGNGLREGGTFERRYRDFRAMPLHINVHQDRVTHQLGRFVLDIERDAF